MNVFSVNFISYFLMEFRFNPCFGCDITRSDPSNPMKIGVSDPQSIRNAHFVPGPIKFLIHGYTGNKDYSPNTEIRPGALSYMKLVYKM